jgi:pimeloyl-ACP methyl ester carboxylesterase
VVIFLHGLGATHSDGMNDWRSGGNLNRIKNLMVRNGGAYLSVDYSGGRGRRKREVAALIDAFAENSTGAPIILACASMGARICWDLAADPSTAAQIDGMIMLSAVGRSSLASDLAARPPVERIAIYIAHSSADRSVTPRQQLRLFNDIKAKAPDYPIRFVLFDRGIHRTPLRMVDWRLAINWIAETRAR